VDALKKWTQASPNDLTKIAIYSSGSIFAQKLLFEHVQDPGLPNDPSAIINMAAVPQAHYDTTNAGPKHERSSYITIAKDLQVEPNEILFLSDSVKEVHAATEAGLQAAVVSRPGNAPLSEAEREQYSVLDDFSKIGIKAN
jgi:enolase-phosphatase E1